MEMNLVAKETRHIFLAGTYRVDLFEEWSTKGRFFTLRIQTKNNDEAKVVENAIHAESKDIGNIVSGEYGLVSFVSTDPLHELYYNVTQKLLKDAGMNEAVADAIGKKVLELFILRKDCLI